MKAVETIRGLWMVLLALGVGGCTIDPKFTVCESDEDCEVGSVCDFKAGICVLVEDGGREMLRGGRTAGRTGRTWRGRPMW